MPPRAALLPLSSVLHRDAEADACARPLLGRSLLDHQVRLLRETGHDPIVLLGPTGGVVPALQARDVRVARSAADAADLLQDADRVTLLGHGVLMAPSLLSEERLLVCPAQPGWERIDAQRAWGGALVLPAEVVCATLDELGDWDAQATLLRVAVQHGVRPHPVTAAEVVHGFAGGGAATLLTGEAERRVARDDGLISTPVQRALRPLALSLAHRTTVPVGEIGLAMATSASVALALLARPVAAFTVGAIAAALLALTLAGRRLRRAERGWARGAALLALASLPALAGWVGAGGVTALLGLTVSGVVAVQSSGTGLPAWGRCDVVLLGLAAASAGLGLVPALALALALLGLAPALRPTVRRRMGAMIRGPGG